MVFLRNLQIAQSSIISGYFDRVCLESLGTSPINIFHHKFALYKKACTMNFFFLLFFDKLKIELKFNWSWLSRVKVQLGSSSPAIHGFLFLYHVCVLHSNSSILWIQPRNRPLRDLYAARLDVLESLKRLQVNSIECLIVFYSRHRSIERTRAYLIINVDKSASHWQVIFLHSNSCLWFNSSARWAPYVAG